MLIKQKQTIKWDRRERACPDECSDIKLTYFWEYLRTKGISKRTCSFEQISVAILYYRVDTNCYRWLRIDTFCFVLFPRKKLSTQLQTFYTLNVLHNHKIRHCCINVHATIHVQNIGPLTLQQLVYESHHAAFKGPRTYLIMQSTRQINPRITNKMYCTFILRLLHVSAIFSIFRYTTVLLHEGPLSLKMDKMAETCSRSWIINIFLIHKFLYVVRCHYLIKLD
jgi:hypothetical protein